MSESTGRPSSHSTRKTRLIATIPEPQTWASCRSTKLIGPPWRRIAQKSAAQAPRPTVKSSDVGPAGRHPGQRQRVGRPEEDQQGDAVVDPELAPVLEHRGVMGLAQQPARPGAEAGRAGRDRLVAEEGLQVVGHRRGASDSDARAASAGTAGRSSPGRGGPAGLSTRGGTGSCSSTSIIVSIGRGGLERRAAGEHVVEDRPQAVDVARRAERPATERAPGLLGRHVARRAHAAPPRA